MGSARETVGCRTLLVEDHGVMRNMLGTFLARMGGMEVIGAVATAEDALQFCKDSKPRVALIDVSLPGMSGLDLVVELKQLYADIHCIMLSGHQEITYVQRALDSGASGYILKGEPLEMLGGIEDVLCGSVYLSDALREKMRLNQPDRERGAERKSLSTPEH